MAENLEFLRNLVRDYVDIVFANEDEAKTFACEAEPLNALQCISEMCELAVVKIGIKGAMIKHGDEVVHVGILAAAPSRRAKSSKSSGLPSAKRPGRTSRAW